jgi:hypothetical protein
MDTYNTSEAIDEAVANLEHAQQVLEEAVKGLAEARREHERATVVLESHKEASDDDLLEELHDEGFDYETAEAIIRFERHDWHTKASLQELSDEELAAVISEKKDSKRVLALAEQETKHRVWKRVQGWA